MLPRCVACGVRIHRGDGVCTTCGETRTPRTVAPIRRDTITELRAEGPPPPPPKKPRVYKPKVCLDERCRRTFTPTGPRDVYCGTGVCR